MAGNNIKPRQHIPYSEKDKEWRKRSYDYYSSSCKDAIDSAEGVKLYRLANGVLDEADYRYITNPLNSNRPELQGYPARIRNYDIISPNLNILMADKQARNYPPIVYAKNSDYETKKTKELKKQLVQYLQMVFMNEVSIMGGPFNQEQVDGKLQEIEKKIASIPDEIAKDGQDAIDCIMDYCEVPMKHRIGFYHFVVTGMYFSYRDVVNDKVVFEVLNPIDCAYAASTGTIFLEDGDAFRCRHYMTIGDIYDRFQNEEGFDEIREELDNYDNMMTSEGTSGGYFSYDDSPTRNTLKLFENLGISPSFQSHQGIPVEHTVWRSGVKVGTVRRINFDGSVEEFEVNEDYKVSPGEEIAWKWEDEIWEGYLINDKHHIAIRPIPVCRGKHAKLPYNGRNYLSFYSIPQSIVKKGEPYQKAVNIIRYTLERTLAKNMDKLVVFPLGLIPNKEGWDEKSVIYYAQALSFLFIDESNERALAALQALKQIDLSLGQYVVQSQELINMMKQEWDEISGISAQRKANISPSAGKGTTDAAIQRSFAISEELFLQFEEAQQRDYTTMIEFSKYAYSEGANYQFMRPDKSIGLLNIVDPERYVNTDFKVFVKNSAKEHQRLEQLRNNAQAFAQNAVKPSVIAKLLETDDMTKIIEILDQMETDMIAQQQAAQEQEAQLAQAQLEQKERERLEELDFKYYKTDQDNRTKLEQALIQQAQQAVSDVSSLEGTETPSGELDTAMKNVQDSLMKMMELKAKDKDRESKERMNKDNNKTKEKIANLQAKTALKNKVSGEK